MNSAQIKQLRQWVICFAVLGALVLFDDFFAENAAWLRWVAFGGLLIAFAQESRSRAQLEFEGRARIDGVVNRSPWLRVWLAFWAVVFFGGAVYVTRNSVDVVQLLGFRFVLLGLIVLAGPLIVASEMQRFKELGGGDRAI
ncbi:hypothetical protein FN976_17595 [Caenimonas sedimenti]|uniref:Uncharacterized protein n=1 Tax=Caenimonas sedimenti TaxID=2596921 RepID=A0A562ZML0_9BURK|nr:hypothetical protein [Caenimonas sedimenti]TWO69647.1 hypothetical protein FN976_17595 [Caenimonas sedimenti]